MNNKITIGISILLLIIIAGINISYASRSKNEKDFFKVSKEEISPGETLEITFDISSLEYKKFKILLDSNIDVKDVYTETNENITIEDNDDAISIEIDKEKMNLNQITLYYPISKDIEIGTKIQLITKIIVKNETQKENEINNNIVTTETENEKNTTNTDNLENENNKNQEEIVKEITKIITVVKKDEKSTNNSNDKKQEDKQEISNEEKSDSKQEQKNNVSGNTKSSLSETSINIENQATYNGSSNNYLAKLEIEGINLNTSFNKENGTYFIDINNTSTINITAIAEDSEARVYITGNDNIQNGNNKILISVTAENGEVRYYRVFVNCKEGIDET